jgi:hypothetical protein
VIDGFSKFTWLYATKSTGTAEVLDRLKQQAASETLEELFLIVVLRSLQKILRNIVNEKTFNMF